MATPDKVVEAWVDSIKTAVLAAAENGTREVVAAVAGKSIRVVGGIILASGALQNMTWKSATTAITGAMDLELGIPLVLPFCEVGYFHTAVAEALNVVLTDVASGGISGVIRYVEL